MSSQEEPQSIGKVMEFLQEWDHGDKTTRHRMLTTFVTQNQGKTYYELETAFALGASLFLARLTTWIRLTYPSSQGRGWGLRASELCRGPRGDPALGNVFGYTSYFLMS